MNEMISLLERVQSGEISVQEAYGRINPIEDLGYAKVDFNRRFRQGLPEVIFGSGKTEEQIFGIISSMLDRGEENILITRLAKDMAESLIKRLPIEYDERARIAVAARRKSITAPGYILVATGGTSDIPVAEETAITAEVLGNDVHRLYDVGVAGIHRLLSKMDEITSARVIVAVAGMEGALASVIGGLARCPVIAVPTSVGYGANLGGLSALLSMLNSCSAGVGVVNIDNGFGAGCLASRINHTGVTI